MSLVREAEVLLEDRKVRWNPEEDHRWAVRGDFGLFHSKVTGAYYAAHDGGQFFRSKTTDSKALRSWRLSETIRQDRDWLYGALDRAMGPDWVKIHEGTMPAPEPEVKSLPAPVAPLGAIQVDRRVTRIIVEDEEFQVELDVGQVCAALATAGLAVGSDPKMSTTNDGKLRLRWTQRTERMEEGQ